MSDLGPTPVAEPIGSVALRIVAGLKRRIDVARNEDRPGRGSPGEQTKIKEPT